MKNNNQLGIPGFNLQCEENQILSKKEKKYSDYASFVKKFTGKHTTDECYTPQSLYNALLLYFRKKIIGERNVVRPFFKNGDYTKYPYKIGDVVFDNPPFSMHAQICRWYISHNIDFILFAQTNTMCVINEDELTYIITDQKVVYENGASVSTSFVTNMDKTYRFIVDNNLCDIIHNEMKKIKKTTLKYDYDIHFTSTALLRKFAGIGIDVCIRKDQSTIVDNFDAKKKNGQDMFGKGIILSDGAAMINEKATNLLRTKREDMFDIYPSEREKMIINKLTKNENG